MVKLASNVGYEEEAPDLLVRFEASSFEDKHDLILSLIPAVPHFVLDVGAGTGHDAAWFAERGAQVVAVEPTNSLRAGAQRLQPSARISWLDEGLPDLAQTRELGIRFDLVWACAVWMHLDCSEREAALDTLAAVSAPHCVLMISLRHGPVPEGRRMFDVGAEETIEAAGRRGFSCIFNARHGSKWAGNRALGVEWTRLVFKRNG